MTTHQNLRFTRLLDWVEGRLSDEENAQVAAAVALARPEVHDTVEWIGQFQRASRAMPLATPPEGLTERLVRSFSQHTPNFSGAPFSEARLLHDTRMPSAAAGMRTSSTQEVVHMVLDTELGRLLLDVVRVAPNLLDIRGFVAFADDNHTAVELSFLHDRALRGMTRSGRGGQFEVLGVSDQIDELWVTRGDVRVRASVSFHA